MDKKTINEISAEKMVNMSRIFRAMGYEDNSEIYTRLNRPKSTLPGENFERKFELKLIETLAEVVRVGRLDLSEVIPRLLAEAGTHMEQQYLLENLQLQTVKPVAYWHHHQGIIAVYLEEDAYRPRASDHDSKSRFMSPKQFMRIDESKGDLELTPRGKAIVASLMQSE